MIVVRFLNLALAMVLPAIAMVNMLDGEYRMATVTAVAAIVNATAVGINLAR